MKTVPKHKYSSLEPLTTDLINDLADEVDKGIDAISAIDPNDNKAIAKNLDSIIEHNSFIRRLSMNIYDFLKNPKDYIS